MKFNGTEKQNKWAEKILTEANLTDEQIDNLLKWAGPTLYSQGIMDAIIVIDNRRNLSAYADSLGKFLKLSQAEKHAVAEEACGVVRGLASINISSAAAAIGRIGGSAKSERKAASSRENGKLGGRPKNCLHCGNAVKTQSYLFRIINGTRSDVSPFCSNECAKKYAEQHNITDVPHCSRCGKIIINAPSYESLSSNIPVHHDCLSVAELGE